MNNSINIFSNQIVSLIQNTLATPLINWLKTEKNVDVTLDEVMSVLELPMNATSRSNSPNTSNTDPKPRTRKSKKTETSAKVETGSCEFVYKVKSKQGQICGESTTNGSHFCRKHKKSASSPQSTASTTNNEPTFVTPEELPKLLCKPTTYLGLVRESTKQVIIHDQPNKKPVAYAVELEDGSLRPLNSDETTFMIKSGVDVSNKPLPNNCKLDTLFESLKTSKPPSFSMPQVSVPSKLPQLPMPNLPTTMVTK